MSQHNSWALILAAGEGSRLRSLTTTADGRAIPKQFCSLQGGPSLMDEALRRAAAVATPEHVCAVVAAQHRQWWQEPLLELPMQNIIVQPENRGTANGILLPLLHIAARDPEATVLLLPADHHVRDEETLAASLREATALAAAQRNAVFLLGVEPDEADTELGYIVPVPQRKATALRVQQFVEKPALPTAQALIERGALWNVFIVAASVRALLALYQQRFAQTVAEMRLLVDSTTSAKLAYYQQLSSKDFSRDVLEGQESVLRVLAVPNCGWTDLGTPQRVASTLQRLRLTAAPVHVGPTSAGLTHLRPVAAYLNLAAQYSRLQFSMQKAAS
jgi:mannose-1-phosphate guanylyltransferase